jgi:predicted metal-dependent hydrolase
VLEHLAAAASAAYDHVESKALRAEANGLRAENAMHVREQQMLREMIETLRSAARSVER